MTGARKQPHRAEARPDHPELEWPTHPHAEEVVLGNALQNWPRVHERIGPDLFWDKKRQRILRAMLALEDRGEPVDTRTVVEELQRSGLEDGDLSALARLEDVLVFERVDLERYIGSLESARTLRAVAIEAHAISTEASMSGADIRDIERRVEKLARTARERGPREQDAGMIEIPSPWKYEDSISFLIEDLLIEKGVTMFSGESGDGKSTFMLALAAAVASGRCFLGRPTVERPVLYLDRENPVGIIKERLLRLGIPDISDRLKIWGGWWRDHYPPGPDAGAILAYAERAKPLIVWDSLIAFADCDENSSSEMRSHMNHYRRLVDLGATCSVIHHRSEKSEAKYRGSSDIRAVPDAAWEIARDDGTNAAEALGRLRLTPYKTRGDPKRAIRIEYRGGVFVPLDAPPRPPVDIVVDLVRSHPGTNQKEMKKLGPSLGLSEHRTLAAIDEAIVLGRIIARRTRHNVLRYYPPEAFLSSAATPN